MLPLVWIVIVSVFALGSAVVLIAVPILAVVAPLVVAGGGSALPGIVFIAPVWVVSVTAVVVVFLLVVGVPTFPAVPVLLLAFLPGIVAILVAFALAGIGAARFGFVIAGKRNRDQRGWR